MYSTGFLKIYKSSKIVISVGNLSMGGTGKTPMVEYLIRLIGEKDVGVLSRGYVEKPTTLSLQIKNTLFVKFG